MARMSDMEFVRVIIDRSRTAFHHSPLSNTGAFAGVIVGVSVSCLVIIGFFIYQIKYRKLKPHTLSPNSARFSQLASSATVRPTKIPPPASPHAPIPNHPSSHPPDHTSSNPFSSTRRSSLRSVDPAVANSSNDGSRPGPLFTPPDTPSDRNGLQLAQRSEQTSLPQSNTRSPFALFSSGLSDIISYRGRRARASIGAASSATSQAASVPRPLPFPPHSPPPYSSNRASLQPFSTQNNSSATSPLSSVFPYDEKRRSPFASDGISRVGQPQPLDSEYQIPETGPSTATDDNLVARRSQSPFRDPNRAAPPGGTLAAPTRAPQDSMMNSTSTEMEHGNAPPSSWRSSLSPFPPRPTSVISDPFNNRGFELPGWIDSDPYSRSGQGPRARASVYSVTQRSVAASSKILPSDTSLRTLTPEPSEDHHDATLHVAVVTKFRTASVVQGTDEGATAEESVEGDGPESYSVRISGGAERRGWGTDNIQQRPRLGSQRRTWSGSRARPRLLHIDRLSSEIGNPALASSSSTATPPGVPLSAEFEGRGLGRSFIQSLIGRVRWPSTVASDNLRLPTIPQEATRGPEGVPTWLGEVPFEMPRASMGAASSKLLPSEAGHGDASSIRSISAEVGWIGPYLETASVQSLSQPISEPVDGNGTLDAPLSAINEEVGWIGPYLETANVQSPSQPIPEPVDGTGTLGAPLSAIDEEPGLSQAPDVQGSSQSQSQQSQSQPRPLPPIPVPPPP